MKSMKVLLVVLISVFSYSKVYAQTKAVKEILPLGVQAYDAKKGQAQNKKDSKEAPCDDKKEDILKKLEEEKKAQAMAGKGLSLQGAKDTGCSVGQ